MIANWTVAISALRAKMLNRGLLLPDDPIVNGKWHPCGAGWYNLSPALPLMALFHNTSDGQAPSVWQEDENRRMTMAEEQRVRDAAAKKPTVSPASRAAVLGDVNGRHGRRVHTALEAAKRLLIHILAVGPVATEEIRAKAGGAGASWASVRRAAALLGVIAERRGFGGSGCWLWRLP